MKETAHEELDRQGHKDKKAYRYPFALLPGEQLRNPSFYETSERYMELRLQRVASSASGEGPLTPPIARMHPRTNIDEDAIKPLPRRATLEVPADVHHSPRLGHHQGWGCTKLQSQPVVDVITRDVQGNFPIITGEPTAPTVKANALPISLLKEGSTSASDELEGDVKQLAVEKIESPPRQAKDSLRSSGMTLPPSLPLLVDKVLQYLPMPYIEPPIPEGKIRVRWKSVSPIIC